MDSDLTPQILKRAYEIWESEGRPHGRDRDHWFLAEAELSTIAAPPIGEPNKPKRKVRSVVATAKPTKQR
jgi:hypothetical protein